MCHGLNVKNNKLKTLQLNNDLDRVGHNKSEEHCCGGKKAWIHKLAFTLINSLMVGFSRYKLQSANNALTTCNHTAPSIEERPAVPSWTSCKGIYAGCCVRDSSTRSYFDKMYS